MNDVTVIGGGVKDFVTQYKGLSNKKRDDGGSGVKNF